MEKPALRLRDILRILLSSSLSLFVLLLLLLLLTGMEQGIIIIVALFDSPGCMLLTILLINFLALILSHFPYYFESVIKDREYEIGWRRKKFLGLFSFIYNINPSAQKEHWVMDFIRRHIGLLCYGLFFYILVFVRRQIFEVQDHLNCPSFEDRTTYIMSIWMLVFFLIHIFLYNHFKGIKSRISNLPKKSNGNWNIVLKEMENLQTLVRRHLSVFALISLINGLLIAYLYISIERSGWSLSNLNTLMFICMLNALGYIYFRLIRPWFIYFFKASEQRDNTCNDYPMKDLGEAFYVSSFLRPLRFIASSPNYLAAMGLFGIPVIGLTMLRGSFDDNFIQDLHPIPLMLVIIIFYYSAIVILLKQYIYLRYRQRLEHSSSFLKYTLPITLILLLIAAFFSSVFFVGKIDNDLHTLPLVEKHETSNTDKFIQSLAPSKNYFILASYGGGLKANSWNLFILNEIEKSNPEFFQKTLCMSGVSGGALGLANYSALKFHHPCYDFMNYESKINSIAESNMLSNDIFGWLYKDYWREWIPTKDFYQGRDRSYLSMTRYSDIINTERLEFQIAMSDYWSILVKDGYFPPLVINTSPTSSRYGIASSIEKLSFPNAIDILDHSYIQGVEDYPKFRNNKEYSLSYFHAVSVTNRFPIFSPSARIRHKGHFVDGGYFENSGLMNALAFYNNVKKKLPKDHTVKAVNIINDKGLYILEKLTENKISLENHTETVQSEILSIFNGLVALERMPQYMRKQYEMDSIEIVNLFMPYIFSKTDIKEFLRIDEFHGIPESIIDKMVVENRDEILVALKKEEGYNYESWGLVTPPLGRLLSEPAVVYQKAMISRHRSLREKLSYLTK